MTTIEFEPWPKIARLNRNIVITEKLDGTNAAVVIVEVPLGAPEFGGPLYPDQNRLAIVGDDSEVEYHVYAQSRNRFITPQADNYGFAGWVQRNAEELVSILGPGRHFGEWWGAGIQRGYGLRGDDRRFSLFNSARWGSTVGVHHDYAVPGLRRVPIIYEGAFSEDQIAIAIEELRDCGSAAMVGFMRPEGIVIWHEAARLSFKVTLEGDEAPKATPRREHDLLPEAVAA